MAENRALERSRGTIVSVKDRLAHRSLGSSLVTKESGSLQSWRHAGRATPRAWWRKEGGRVLTRRQRRWGHGRSMCGRRHRITSSLNASLTVIVETALTILIDHAISAVLEMPLARAVDIAVTFASSKAHVWTKSFRSGVEKLYIVMHRHGLAGGRDHYGTLAFRRSSLAFRSAAAPRTVTSSMPMICSHGTTYMRTSARAPHVRFPRCIYPRFGAFSSVYFWVPFAFHTVALEGRHPNGLAEIRIQINTIRISCISPQVTSNSVLRRRIYILSAACRPFALAFSITTRTSAIILGVPDGIFGGTFGKSILLTLRRKLVASLSPLPT